MTEVLKWSVLEHLISRKRGKWQTTFLKESPGHELSTYYLYRGLLISFLFIILDKKMLWRNNDPETQLRSLLKNILYFLRKMDQCLRKTPRFLQWILTEYLLCVKPCPRWKGDTALNRTTQLPSSNLHDAGRKRQAKLPEKLHNDECYEERYSTVRLKCQTFLKSKLELNGKFRFL